MARKITKAQAKRLLKAIGSKAKLIWLQGGFGPTSGYGGLPTPDLIAIEKIVARNLKRLG